MKSEGSWFGLHYSIGENYTTISIGTVLRRFRHWNYYPTKRLSQEETFAIQSMPIIVYPGKLCMSLRTAGE